MTTSEILKSVATDKVKARPKTILDYLDDKRVQTGLAAVAGKFLSADRVLRLCVNAIKKTPKLIQCEPQSVLGALMTSTALGLEPNTVQQQAFLIPYKKRAKIGGQWVDVLECQFQIGYRGFITLMYRSKRVVSVTSSAIHRGDVFDNEEGSNAFLRYKKALEERGELIGSFSYVKLTDMGESSCVLPLDEVYKIRARSESFRTLSLAVEQAENDKDRRKAEDKLAECPWVMWEDDMAAKSAIKKHAKGLPIASNDALLGLVSASEVDDSADAGVLDLASLVDPDHVKATMAGDDPPKLENHPSETIEGMGGTVGAQAKQGEIVDADPFATKQQQTAQTIRPLNEATAKASAGKPVQQRAQPKTNPAFDYEAALDRINACNSSEELGLMVDKYNELPDGPGKDSLFAAYRVRNNELEDEQS